LKIFILDKIEIEKLVKLQIDKIFISLDGATKETYEKIRVGSNFDKVIENVKHLIRLKKEKKAYFPEINFHFVAIKENYKEMPQFVELVHFITGKNTNIQFSQLLHNFKEVKDLFIKIPEEIRKITEARAKHLKIRLSWNADATINKPPIKKCTEWTMPFIFVTGEVIPCCAKNEANQRSLQKQTSMGNIFQTPFKKIWYGQEYTKLKKMILKGKIPIQCKNCPLYENCH
jgi:radical SAM protein with 4Fe4S-binding SPASM domain